MAVHVVVVSEAFFTIPLLIFGNFSSAALLWWRTFRSLIGCMMGMASDPFLNDRFFLDGLRQINSMCSSMLRQESRGAVCP